MKTTCSVRVKTISESLASQPIDKFASLDPTLLVGTRSPTNQQNRQQHLLQPYDYNTLKKNGISMKSSHSDLPSKEFYNKSSDNLDDTNTNTVNRLDYAKKRNLSSSFSNLITSVRNGLRFVRASSPANSSNHESKKQLAVKSKTKAFHRDSSMDTTIKKSDESSRAFQKRSASSNNPSGNHQNERVFFSLLRFNIERKFRKNKKVPKNVDEKNDKVVSKPPIYCSSNTMDPSLTSQSKNSNFLDHFDGNFKVSKLLNFNKKDALKSSCIIICVIYTYI
jgi:hypothetical protein